MNKFSKLTSVFLSALLLSMSSCGSDEIGPDIPTGPEVGPGGSLLITGEIGDKEAQTKVSETFPDGATNASGAKYAFKKDDVIGVFITGGNTSAVVQNAAYKFVGENTAWMHIDETNYKKQPVERTEANPILWSMLGARSTSMPASTFSAMYPYDKALTDKVFDASGVISGGGAIPSNYVFTVKDNQNIIEHVDSLSNYEKSDLLFAGKISRLEQKANFVFKHKMSRILINVRAGDGYKDLEKETLGLNRFKDDYDTICHSPAKDALKAEMQFKLLVHGKNGAGFANGIGLSLVDGTLSAISSTYPTGDYFTPRLYKKEELPVAHFNKFAKTYAILVPAQTLPTTRGEMLRLVIKEAGKTMPSTITDPNNPKIDYPTKVTDGEMMLNFAGLKEGEQLVLNLTVSKSSVVIDDVRIADWGTLGEANISDRNGIYDAKDLVDFIGDLNRLAAKTEDVSATDIDPFLARWATTGGTINIWNNIDFTTAEAAKLSFVSIDSLKGFTNKFILDGTNYTIKGLTSPLFKNMNCATVRNLKVEAAEGATLQGGVLARKAAGSTIVNCSATGTVLATADVPVVGGLIGQLSMGKYGAVTQHSYVTNCWANVKVIADGEAHIAGGLIGEVVHGVITNSYALGNVGKARVITSSPEEDDKATRGGFIGKISSVPTAQATKDSTTIINCYSRGIILPRPTLLTSVDLTPENTPLDIVISPKRGAFIGEINKNCTMSYCFWNAEAIAEIKKSNGVTYPATNINHAIGTIGIQKEGTEHPDFKTPAGVAFRNLCAIDAKNNNALTTTGLVVKGIRGNYPKVNTTEFYNLLNILIAEAVSKKNDSYTTSVTPSPTVNLLQDWALYGGTPIHTGVDVKQ